MDFTIQQYDNGQNSVRPVRLTVKWAWLPVKILGFLIIVLSAVTSITYKQNRHHCIDAC
jgi:hypothetical protein